jgi:hypothetical protein
LGLGFPDRFDFGRCLSALGLAPPGRFPAGDCLADRVSPFCPADRVSPFCPADRVSPFCLTDRVSPFCLTDRVSPSCLTDRVSPSCLTDRVSPFCLTDWVLACCFAAGLPDCDVRCDPSARADPDSDGAPFDPDRADLDRADLERLGREPVDFDRDERLPCCRSDAATGSRLWTRSGVGSISPSMPRARCIVADSAT